MNASSSKDSDALVLEESMMKDSELIAAAQLIFAEKRTALALLRTGISVFALPLAVVSALIATSKFYDAASIMHLLIPVMAINLALVLLGIYLVSRSIVKMHHQERIMTQLKASHPALVHYFD